MHKSCLIPFVFILSIICNYTYGQTRNYDSLVAASYFENEDYNRALKAYLELYKKDKKDVIVNYRIGHCYMNINDDKSKAIPYFEYVYTKGGYKDDLLFEMGRAYTYAYNFEDALTFFNHYRRIIYSKRFELIDNYYQDCLDGKIDYQKKITVGIFGTVDHYIENCESATELFKNPLNVSFENLGKDINTKYADYHPFITKDEGKLYFTSRRTDTDSIPKWLTELPADIYYSSVKDGQWTRAAKLGQINTAEDESCVYVGPDGKNMVVYQENENSTGDLSVIPIEGQPGKLESFSGPINTQFREYEGCITEDGNAVIFSSDREGGLGETDLYIVKKLPNGQWSVPYNLGPNVNTKYKEAFPSFDEKSNTLYFSSEGHINMGGFDIFSSALDTSTNTFEESFNMGFPINTPEDDMQFTLSENKREGFISAIRREGYGDYDIYKLVFNSIEKRPSVIRGIVSIKDADTLRKEIAATISIKDAIRNKELDSKKVNFQTGRYIFAVDNPGKYTITVKTSGFRDVEHEINLYDKSDYVFEIENDFLIQKDAVNEKALAVSDTMPVPSETYSINKLPVNVIIWGIIKTDIPLESDINASIVVQDASTHQDIIKKNANPKSGKYSFSVGPGKYIINVTSPGYKLHSEEVNTEELSAFIQTGKNITLQRIVNTEAITEKTTEESSTVVSKTDSVTELVTKIEFIDPVATEEDTSGVKKYEDIISNTGTKDEKTKKTPPKTEEKTTITKKPEEKAAVKSVKKQGTTAKKPASTAKKQSTSAKKQSTGTTKKTNTGTTKKAGSAKKSTVKKPASTKKATSKDKSSAKFN